MNNNPFMPPFEDLPGSVPVFPLTNAVLMPMSRLPLTIFEPRYLEMVQDAMKGDRLIGMIQPCDEQSPPSLHRVGCVGRITQYEETDDGRLGILLTGLCRFMVSGELPSIKQYRIVTPDWSDFAHDYQQSNEPSPQTNRLFNNALRSFLNRSKLDIDFQSLEKLNIGTLADNLLGFLPLSPEDKQLLIEINTLENRLLAFITILESDNCGSAVQH